MTFYLTVTSFNCRGLSTDPKHAPIFAQFRCFDAQTILLQEAFSKPDNEAIWAQECSSEQALFSSLSGHSRQASGTPILLRHPKLWFGLAERSHDGRVVRADIQHRESSINVISVYASTSCQLVSVTKIFFTLITLTYLEEILM